MKAIIWFYLTLFFFWVVNIVTFVDSFTTFGEMTGFQIIQIIGIFTGPVGSVVGLISLF